MDARPRSSRELVVALVKLAQAAKLEAARHAGDEGMSATQGQILGVLLARRPAAPRASELARDLGVTRATVSDALAALERKGLVRRERARDDRRAVLVALTSTGARRAERFGRWTAALEEAVAGLGDDARRAMLRGALELIRTLQRHALVPPARMCLTCRYFRPNVHDDPERPHHCAFVDAPFGDAALKADCPDHEVAGTPV